MGAMKENWRAVVGWPEYQVSDRGRVRRVLPASGKNTTVGHVLRNRPVGAGYFSVQLSRHGKAKPAYVHRLVAEAFCSGRDREKQEVNHKDHDKTNNRASNLEWVSRRANMTYAARHGRMAHGENAGNSKLTEHQVREIRRRVSGGESRVSIARDFPVGDTQIGRIARGQAWRRAGRMR